MNERRYRKFNSGFLKFLALSRYKYAKSDSYLKLYNSAYYFLLIARDYGLCSKIFVKQTKKFYDEVSEKLRIECEGKELMFDKRIVVKNNKISYKIASSWL